AAREPVVRAVPGGERRRRRCELWPCRAVTPHGRQRDAEPEPALGDPRILVAVATTQVRLRRLEQRQGFGRAARDDQGGTEPGTCPRDARMCVRQASLVDRERPAQRRLRFPEPPGHPVQVAEVLQGGADVDVLLAERLAPQGERALQHFTRLLVAAEL